MMSRIRGKNTQPEIVVRKGLHHRGFRYRLHVRGLPGNPDIVFPKYEAVCFVNGCYWHRHPGCQYATTPATRTGFWKEKFAQNVKRDRHVLKLLADMDWRAATVWECDVKHRPESVIDHLSEWLKETRNFSELDTIF